MSVQSGFGVNYKAAQASWNTDIKYFNAIGLSSLCTHLPSAPDPWSAGTPSNGNYAYWRLCAQTFTNAGFYVAYGFAGLGVTLTSSNWPNFHDSVVAEATYLTSQGILLDEFCIGNELEHHIDGTTITVSNLVTLLKTLATDVKAVYGGKVGYRSTINGAGSLAVWQSQGLGNIDYLSTHPYGVITGNSFDLSGFPFVPTYAGSFGAGTYVSEFNLDSQNADLISIPDSQAVTWMQTALPYMTPYGKFWVYTWCEFLGNNVAEYGFAQLRSGGSMNPMWFDFFTSQPMFYTPRSTTIQSRTTANRSTASRTATPTRALIFS